MNLACFVHFSFFFFFFLLVLIKYKNKTIIGITIVWEADENVFE